MRLLLDTNVYVAWKRGDAVVARHVRGAERLYLSTVVAGELLFGFRHGSRYQRNRAELDAFVASPFVTLVPVTLETADRYGRIAAALRRRGTPVPTNDVWIAAHAFESGAELLSFDHHFELVDGLAWTDPRAA
jgi:tRNA(fMet)-specific endonuclease VapC